MFQPIFSEIELWRIFVSLGVPGLALGVLYMLFKGLGWTLPAVPGAVVGLALILFILVVGGITLAALYMWRPIQPEAPLDSASLKVVTDPIDALDGPFVPIGDQFRFEVIGARDGSTVKWSTPKVGELSGTKGNPVRYRAKAEGRESITATVRSGTERATRDIHFDVDDPIAVKEQK